MHMVGSTAVPHGRGSVTHRKDDIGSNCVSVLTRKIQCSKCTKGRLGFCFSRELLVGTLVIRGIGTMQAGLPACGGRPSFHASQSKQRATLAEDQNKGREATKEVSNNLYNL